MSKRKMKKNINKKIFFYCLYTFIVLFLPLIIECLDLYDFPDIVLVTCVCGFGISLVGIIAIENKRMIDMVKKDYPDIYTKIINDRAAYGFVDSYFNIDSFFKLDDSGCWGEDKNIWSTFKEKIPQYWEYSVQLRIYIIVSIILTILSNMLVLLRC